MQRYDLLIQGVEGMGSACCCTMSARSDGEFVLHADAEAELAALRARVAELELELARKQGALSVSRRTVEEFAVQASELRARLATLEAPPVVPLDYEVELLDESGPNDEPFMQWGFSDLTTSDGENSNDNMTPEHRRDLAQLYRSLAWAIEHDQRPPHASDGKEGGE